MIEEKIKLNSKLIVVDAFKSGQKQNETHVLHKPIKKKFETRKFYVHGIDNQWQADLDEMQEFSKDNEGFKYLLTVIDCFSKFAWAIPIKDKAADKIIESFNKIFKNRKPSKLQTDKGKEFINKKFQDLLKKNNIHRFSTNSDLKASIVERFNRTLKTKMWKYFTEMGHKRWIDVNDLVYNYNNSFHRSIKMTPVEGSKKENESIVYKNLYRESEMVKKSNKFKVGDKVRISKWKGTFEKGYLPNWTTELFTVSKILNTNPATYKVKDFNDDEIEGSFYEPELVRFNKQDDVYEVEKILKTRIRNGKEEYLIKWKSYAPEFNSWIPAENLK